MWNTFFPAPTPGAQRVTWRRLQDLSRNLTIRVSSPVWAAVYPAYALLFVLCCIVFWLNKDHNVEQTIWQQRYVVLADSLLDGGRYLHPEFEGVATYPIWGYPTLAAAVKALTGDADDIYFLQFILFAVSAYLVFRMVTEQGRISPLQMFVWFIGIFYYAMAMSAKWPDAIMAFLLLMTALAHYRRLYLPATLALGLAYNFRADALAFFLIYAIYLIATRRKYLAVGIGLSLVLPWGSLHYASHGKFLLGSTNSGGVLYISLGQLPDNAWQRQHRDEAAVEYVEERGVATPWSIEGDALLKAAFLDDVLGHPFEFLHKAARNALRAFTGGLYLWETREIWLLESLRYLANVFLIVGFAAMTHKIYSRGFRLAPAELFFLAQVTIIAFIQYQPRHMSHVAALLIIPLLERPAHRPRRQYRVRLK